MGGEVRAAGLDPDDASLRVEGDDVDDPEQVLPDPVRTDEGVVALHDPAHPALLTKLADCALGR
jgi:hypothetical protein